MKIALAQIRPKLSPENINKHIEFIEKTDADLVVFPELSMNGYKIKDALLEDAFDIEYFKNLTFSKDVVLGAAIKKEGKIYNSALYIDNEIKIHNKVHLPTYGVFEEGRFFFSGDEFSLFDTKFGKTCMFVCEDVFSGDAINFVSQKKPDLIIVIAASPAREFSDGKLLIEDQWEALLKSMAILSGAYVLFCNRVGFEDGLGFWGGSRVINPKGQTEIKANYFEEELIECELNHNLTLTQKYFLRKD
ncbi:nitrilase/cyanide hydratase and apolipoprotein N-acyltransferase [Nautilia profundicola AmH]|uniref:Nitrilase/cyanide hydratase and apolipoprotein N-acyltransferase n=1 Tax=Nautilia profundicola (strain ATCC BAA-1463 / DSM 18972 / AmH) TaxID=598659 RepID=B9L7Z7_NAUPA|nr:nitrilase-related carbon-nitrogen hydrolase [Nautilia profundicola]ACM93256.1 nitrilase/cyanide hydratase and apolipoprotein N-acyltransferase [Nautilia profundicola AmH]